MGRKGLFGGFFALAVCGFAPLSAPGPVHADQGTIVGQVTEANGFPIEGVRVLAEAASTLTNPGGIYTLEGLPQQERVVVRFEKQAFATTFGIVDLTPPEGDSDGDGVPDSADECPGSDLRETVVINHCNTGVENVVLEDGCSLMDRILTCSERGRPPEERDFVGCVAQLTEGLTRAHIISRHDRRSILRCAKRAHLPLEVGGGSPVAGGPSGATLNKVMVAAGESQIVNAQAGGTLEQNGFRVTFPPGSLMATGGVEVVISPIDVSTSEIGAFPGEFQGLDLSGEETLIETFALMDVDLTQNDQPVDLVTGATASLEFLLPQSTMLLPGNPVGLWFFDEASGLWKEEAGGTVAAATSDASRLAVFGEVTHFSTWNVDRPILVSCLRGFVVDVRGRRVAGASVVADGRYSAQTDSNGVYCIDVPRDTTVDLQATSVEGVVVPSATIEVSTPDRDVNCAAGGCGSGPTLRLTGLSCIRGDVRDASGVPVPGAVVRSTGGGFAATATDGTFCLRTPADTAVTVASTGFLSVTVTTPPDGASCAIPSGCAVAALTPLPPGTGTTTCLSGRVVDENGLFLAGATVQASDAFDGSLIFATVVTDVTGSYCLPDVPEVTDISLSVSGFVPDPGGGGFSCVGGGSLRSGAAGGSCTAGGCTQVPVILCAGF